MIRDSFVRVYVLGIALLLIASQLGGCWAAPAVISAPTPPDVEDGYRTLEMLTMNIGSEGGLSVNVVSVQNASHYYGATCAAGNHFKEAQIVTREQIEGNVGYVTELAIEAVSQFTALTGEVLGPALIVDAVVSPIYVIPDDTSDPYVTSLNWTQAFSLAKEVLMALVGSVITWPESSVPIVYTIPQNATVDNEGDIEEITYTLYRIIDIVFSTIGDYEDVAHLLDILASMGGFMSIVNSTGWPVDDSGCGLILKRVDRASPSLMNGIGIYPGPIAVRHEAETAPGPDEDCDSMIMGRASLYLDHYHSWEDVSVWSLLDYLDYDGPLMNKMYEDPSACSLSIIGATGPNGMSVQGVPDEWLRLDDMPSYPFEIPLEKDGGVIMPGTEDYDVLMRLVNQLGSVSSETNYTVQGRGIVKWFNDAWGPSFDWSWGEGQAGSHMIRDILIHPQGHLFDIPSPLLSLAIFGNLDNGDGVYWIDPDGALGPVLFDALLRSIDSYGLISLLENGSWGAEFNASIASKGFGFIDSLFTEYGISLPALTGWNRQEMKKFLSENWDETVQVFAGSLISSLSAQSARIDGTWIAKEPDELWLLFNQTISDGFDVRPTLVNGLDDFCAVNLDTTYNETAHSYDKASPQLFMSTDIGMSFSLDSEPTLEISLSYLKITKTCSLGQVTKQLYPGNTMWYNITVTNMGVETAYDVRIIDGICPGLRSYDASSPVLFKLASLDPGESWSTQYNITPTNPGVYTERRAICIWFNASIDAVAPDARAWYRDYDSMSEPGGPIEVLASNPILDWITASTMGVPHFVYLTVGVVVLVVAAVVVRRRLT